MPSTSTRPGTPSECAEPPASAPRRGSRIRYRAAARAAAALIALAAPAALTAQVTVTGRVVDSLRGGPLAGAQVQLVLERQPERLAYGVMTDSAGAFQLAGVVPGTYLAGFFHPLLDSLGLRLPLRRLAVGTAGAALTLAVPSGARIARAICPDLGADSSGLVLGRVRDGTSGRRRAGGTVTLRWGELVVDSGGLRQEPRTLRATTDAEGRVAVCGVPGEVELTAWAEAGAETSGRVTLTVPGGGLCYREFLVAPVDTVRLAGVAAPLRTGTARLTGEVRQRDGRPMTAAQVHVAGSIATDTTDRTGRFQLARLPAGTQTLEVLALGYAPKRVAVDLRAGRLDTVTVVVNEPVRTLERVAVYGRRSSSVDRTGFLRRRDRLLGGHFLSPEDLARRNPANVADALRTVPGIIIRKQDQFTDKIFYRSCQPTIYLDGQYLRSGSSTIDSNISEVVGAAELAGAEVYSAATAPAEFLPMGEACGVVVLWTRGALHLPAPPPVRRDTVPETAPEG